MVRIPCETHRHHDDNLYGIKKHWLILSFALLSFNLDRWDWTKINKIYFDLENGLMAGGCKSRSWYMKTLPSGEKYKGPGRFNFARTDLEKKHCFLLVDLTSVPCCHSKSASGLAGQILSKWYPILMVVVQSHLQLMLHSVISYLRQQNPRSLFSLF
jgi:hypothetical protein